MVAAGKLVERRTVRGYPYWDIEPESDNKMPRIRDEFLDCAIYLYPSRHEADEGIHAGGSGFLLEYASKRIPQPAKFIYAVTNKHVILDGKAYVVRLNTQDGKRDIFEFGRNRWFVSDTDDLAIAPMPVLDTGIFKFKCAPVDMLLKKQNIADYDIGPGDEIFMVGRFINHEGKQRNLPTARFGNVAQMPHEMVRYDIDRQTHDQESFLVEVHSIGGYSGSPVFLDPSIFSHRTKPKPPEIFLLGVDWGHIMDWRPVCGPDEKPTGRGEKVEANSGLAGVVPAWRLEELLESPAAISHRTMNEDRYLAEQKKTAGATADIAIPPISAVEQEPPTTEDNPSHREDFRRLVNAAAKTRTQGDGT